MYTLLKIVDEHDPVDNDDHDKRGGTQQPVSFPESSPGEFVIPKTTARRAGGFCETGSTKLAEERGEEANDENMAPPLLFLTSTRHARVRTPN